LLILKRWTTVANNATIKRVKKYLW